MRADLAKTKIELFLFWWKQKSIFLAETMTV
jgi:hypothetical protein